MAIRSLLEQLRQSKEALKEIIQPMGMAWSWSFIIIDPSNAEDILTRFPNIYHELWVVSQSRDILTQFVTVCRFSLDHLSVSRPETTPCWEARLSDASPIGLAAHVIFCIICVYDIYGP